MSKKDFDEYYKILTKQKNEMLSDLKDFEEECEKGMIEPERLKTIEENMQPLLRNWERVTYISFLLNQPVRKTKIAKYKKQHEKEIKKLNPDNNLDSVKKENEEVINSMQNIMQQN